MLPTQTKYYRPEIDGLRAIAVLAVVAYHCEVYLGNLKLVQGGFFGVDVFFVISGYLITSIILREQDSAAGFRLTSFYARRVRRILPALLTVLLVSTYFAYELLQPHQIRDYAKSLLATLSFSSNFYWQYTTDSYAAESGLLKPLLHTWSLAVEEQFYIFYPILLIWLAKTAVSRRTSVKIFSAIVLVSLVYAELMTWLSPSISFFHLPSRVWELLAGGLVAFSFASADRSEPTAPVSTALCTLGLVMILFSLIALDLNSHPGIKSAIPVIGTVLILRFGHSSNWVTTLLSSKPFIAVGLLSYSFYLWHYPVLAYARHAGYMYGVEQKLALVALALTLSVVTYYLVERPFRNRSTIGTKLFCVGILGATLILLASSVDMLSERNKPKEKSSYLRSVLAKGNRVWVRQEGKKCHAGGGGSAKMFPVEESCIFKKSNSDTHLIVLGDSHGGVLAENLRLLANKNGYNFVQITAAGCSHIPYGRSFGICGKRSRSVVEFVSSLSNPIVVYSARIPLFIEQSRFVNEYGDREAKFRNVPKKKVEQEAGARIAAVADQLTALSEVSDKLVLVYPVPEQGYHVRDKLHAKYADAQRAEDLPNLSTSYANYLTRTKRSFKALDQVKNQNVIRIYPAEFFCSEQTNRCEVTRQDKIFFASDNHVSPLGSKMIVDAIASKLSSTEGATR
jgi:peptidoglycan/LPS O-acetylase OafA/YrhL